jgi:hypothetical protein
MFGRGKFIGNLSDLQRYSEIDSSLEENKTEADDYNKLKFEGLAWPKVREEQGISLQILPPRSVRCSRRFVESRSLV